MKFMFLMISFTFLWISNVNWAQYDWDYWIIIEEWDTRESIYKIIKEKDKESLRIWNNHTSTIWWFEKNKVCSVLDELISWERDNSDHLKNYIVWLWCYVNEKWVRKALIKTVYEDEKVFNINLWQQQFNWMILKKWEEVSSNKLLEPLESQFKTWNVLFYNKDKKEVEIRRETGWWICWVTTSLYQNFIYDNNIDIIERWNHSNWYNAYYWKTKWLDAMIYFWQSDFRFRNNNDSNIYLELWWEKVWNNYEYYASTKSLYNVDRNIQHWKEYRDKKWRTCVDTYVWWKTVTSCYRNTF